MAFQLRPAFSRRTPYTYDATVKYTFTGLEGTDFRVNLPTPNPPTNGYTFAGEPSFVGSGNVPELAMPNGVGDRTTASFRVLTAAQQPANDVLEFRVQIIP